MKRADSSHITYTPRPDVATPEAERSALAAAYAFLIQKHQEGKKGGPAMAAPDDAEKEFERRRLCQTNE
jgi:hypothetical protein